MDLLIEKKVPFAEGNIMKYVFRWQEKDGIKDLYKARDYLNALIAHQELEVPTIPKPLPPIHNRRSSDRNAHGRWVPVNPESKG